MLGECCADVAAAVGELLRVRGEEAEKEESLLLRESRGTASWIAAPDDDASLSCPRAPVDDDAELDTGALVLLRELRFQNRRDPLATLPCSAPLLSSWHAAAGGMDRMSMWTTVVLPRGKLCEARAA